MSNSPLNPPIQEDDSEPLKKGLLKGRLERDLDDDKKRCYVTEGVERCDGSVRLQGGAVCSLCGKKGKA
ncbi:hypothetical protein ACUXIL_003418 [Ralstonia pickettii]|nr:hypothetical protein [Ralstonia pickettii]MBA9852097.1 hypothetical protein [Ralstonia pickettii]MBA9919888.1 hypothetical protein [Ralstonia pickettii]MBA9958990.1 hypothetical protein [Ralstonia pickettii]MBA9964631.1 hypothetical protein [Ralstonia pickettii]